MNKRLIVSLALAALVLTNRARAQATVSPTVPAEPTENLAPPLTPADAPPSPSEEAAKPRRQRAVSSEVALSISSALPKYNPPTPTPVVAEEDRPDLREIDKPKNGIIRLPSYITHAQRSPILRERDVYTRSGLAALAIKRFLSDADRGLNSFAVPFFGSSLEKRAMAAYNENERSQNMVELRDEAATASLNDRNESEYIKRASQDTYMRRADFGYQGTALGRDSFGYEGNNLHDPRQAAPEATRAR